MSQPAGQANLRAEELLRRCAEETLDLLQPLAESDPLKPRLHITGRANWINDPNGPVFFDGEYHLFYQHNPLGSTWGNMSWGHVVSKDLAHWEHVSLAMVPRPGGPDANGVFSGCCVVDKGTPTMVYTGVYPEVQCIARGDERLRTWRRWEGNPASSRVHTSSGDFPFDLDGEEALTMHVFFDRSVVELFVNHRECLTARVCPRDPLHPTLSVSGAPACRSLECWRLGPGF
jgi:sucrose-6-phosphate hydrolase SacC (GH32 family)